MNFLAIYAMNDLESWANIRIKDQTKFEKWFLVNENCQEFFDYYDDSLSSLTGGLDTADRDILMDEVAIMLTGRSWPINMESQEVMIDFSKKLKSALKNHEFLIWSK